MVPARGVRLTTSHPYSALTPDVVLDALETVGIRGDGRLLSLNSYENRVYQIWCEDESVVVAKFYRPERWSDAAIGEEHAFVAELAESEIPVVAALVINDATLHSHGGFRFTVYPRRGGRAPELEDRKTLEWIGRFLGRIHAIGASRSFANRPSLDLATSGREPRRYLIEHANIPAELADVYAGVSQQALDGVARAWDRAGAITPIRLHGDCHAGNVLWTDDGPHFVDFDDAREGPAMQDLWMLLSGDRESMQRQLHHVLEGYERFFTLDRRELHLIEALRTLRLVHYAAWIAQRFDDPAFPAAFPWFGTTRYWQDRILELREQVALLDEAPLDVD
ncbi:MAG TPA: serine/threonine protein kinase [Casimicrobiaceae bacterium]|nr:serine/threonine protein kinase [Casimicrobiaceae bacterium]